MIILTILRGLYYKLSNIYYRCLFADFGIGSRIVSPLHLNNPNSIYIGNNTIIRDKAWLAAVPLTGYTEAELRIGSNCQIGHYNEIFATKKIEIGDGVLTADRVYISDNLHRYDDINLPILKQKIKQIGEVSIGDGTWLGIGVCVLGSKIGKNCVIGSNSVVTKDIPDYSVAVGIPARIIKRFDFSINQWRKTNEHGQFI